MSSDFPTFAEVGEENIREREKRLGRKFKGFRIMPLSVPVLGCDELENDAAFHRRYCENEFERGH